MRNATHTSIHKRNSRIAAFPSFNNSGEPLALTDPFGSQIDLIHYNLNWYQDTSKQEGGFSLERCSLQDPCSAADNWRASQAVLGGTPGLANSVLTTFPDTLAAHLLFAEVRDSNIVAFGFSEPMDSLSLVNSIVHISPEIGIFEKQFCPRCHSMGRRISKCICVHSHVVDGKEKSRKLDLVDHYQYYINTTLFYQGLCFYKRSIYSFINFSNRRMECMV